MCYLGWVLIDLHINNAQDRDTLSGGGRLEVEELPARRGLIMDSREEVLTTNIQTADLIADLYHLKDINIITWGLAYSKAVHSNKWGTLDEHGREKLIGYYRRRLLIQAKMPEPEQTEHEEKRENLNVIYRSIFHDENKPTKGQSDQSKDEYNPSIVQLYVSEYINYAAAIIAPILGVSTDEVIEKLKQTGLKKKQMRVVISQNLPEDKAEGLRQALHNARVQGFQCERSWKRSYVAPTCLTHILGYVGYQTEGSTLLSGITGLEKTMDPYLIGQKGFRESRRNNRGQIIPSQNDKYKPPVDGLNIKLTINMDLQTIVEEELDKGLAHFHAPRGTIIVVEPQTGSILAMASRPQFNLNTKENMQEGALNYAVQGLYEPGSTFKVVSVTSAVDTGKLSFNTMIDCSSASVPGSRPVTDAPRHYGMLSVADVLKKSSNPGAFRIGCRAGGWDVYKKYLEAYGFRDKTGIELPAEARSQCQKGEVFANFSRITYGYAIMVTPLQVAMAYAAIANGGLLMKPRLVDTIYDSNGRIVEHREPTVLRRVMKESTSKNLRTALARVAGEGGTARRGNVPGYQIGGKTGTAHKVKEKGGYYDNRYTVSFAGMLPASNPAFVCLVVIDDPHPTDCRPGGGTVGAPIFKNVAERIAKALNIPPTEPIAGAEEKSKIALRSRFEANSAQAKHQTISLQRVG